MSVINDMLRDLDQRRAPEREMLAGAHAANLIEQDHRKIWPYLVLSIILAIVLFGIAWWYMGHDDSVDLGIAKATALSQTTVNSPIPVVMNDVPQTAVSPVQVLEGKAEEEGGTQAAIVQASEQNIAVGPLSETNKPIDSSKAELTHSKAAGATVAKVSAANDSPDTAPNQKTLARANSVSDVKAEALDENSEQLSEMAQVDESSANAKPKQRQPTSKPGEQLTTSKLASNSTLTDKADTPDPVQQDVRLTPIALDQQTAERASRLFAAGESSEARRLLYEFIDKQDQDSFSRIRLAKNLIREQRLAEAEDLLRVVGVKDVPELKAVKARWLASQGRSSQALELLAHTLPPVQEHAEYHALLASFYHQQKQFELAVERYSALLEYDSNVADWWVGMGIGLDQLKRYDDAELAYRQALALPNLKQSLARYSTRRLEQLRRARDV